MHIWLLNKCTHIYTHQTHTSQPREHNYHMEHSIILSLTSAALSHYCTLPILLLSFYLPFCQTSFFSSSTTSTLFPASHSYCPTDYPSMPTKMNRVAEDVGRWWGGRLADLLLYWSDVLWASDSMLTAQEKGHRAVSIHLTWLNLRSDFSHAHTG